VKKVLVLAYYFPPLGLSGVQRTLAFVKYLPLFGWEPTVITVGDIGYYAHDEELLQEVESLGTRVIRTKSFDPHALRKVKRTYSMPKESMRKVFSILSEFFLIPDTKIGWKRFAINAGILELTTTKYDCIFSTAPPYTAHLAATELGAMFSLPVVLDYRDAWVDYPFKRYITQFHRYLHQKKEKKVLEMSSAVVVAAQSIYAPMQKRYNESFISKASVISQGYDPAYFIEKSCNMQSKKEKIVLTYSGVFYENRTPAYFFEAIAQLLTMYPEYSSKIELWFIGIFREEHKALIEKNGLTRIVTLWGYLPHQQCVDVLLQSDIVWAMMLDDCSTPGKIFEYIGAQKHILGCVPENGAMAKIIRQCRGSVVTPDDIPQLVKTIHALLIQAENGTLPVAGDEIKTIYDRKNLTKKLALLFDSLMDTSKKK